MSCLVANIFLVLVDYIQIRMPCLCWITKNAKCPKGTALLRAQNVMSIKNIDHPVFDTGVPSSSCPLESLEKGTDSTEQSSRSQASDSMPDPLLCSLGQPTTYTIACTFLGKASLKFLMKCLVKDVGELFYRTESAH